ncbi:sporulation-induced protein, partial [Coemansia spiralis]
MLWRFGLQHASNIDKVLDKDDLTLEELLGDMDLLREVREQNPKVISYLVQPPNLKQMIDYIATEDYFKFTTLAATAAEVLCSNSIAFADALVADYVPHDLIDSDDDESSDGDHDRSTAVPPPLRAPPRQRLLDQLWSLMRLDAGQVDPQQAALFSRVLCCLMQRKPYQALDFIHAQAGAVDQFVEHLALSPVVDLLLKVISLEELDSGPGVTAWLCDQGLIQMLVDRLAPDCDPETHSLAAQVLLDIIAISQCNNPTQPTIGTNPLITQLKSEATVTRLADYMLDRAAPHATSTLINCVYIFIELIRRNYSDAESAYAQLQQQQQQQQPQSYDDDDDEDAARAAAQSAYPQHDDEDDDEEEHLPLQGSDDEDDDVDEEDGAATHDGQQTSLLPQMPPPPPRELPIVDLSDMMRVLALRVGDLVQLLESPRSSTAPVPTTQGLREPLGFERLRICELFAELLHCSNMPRLNAMPGQSASSSAAESQCDSPTAESGAAMPQLQQQQYDTAAAADHTATNTPVGQLLKWKLVEHAVLPQCMDLFFRFPLNNFLHSVVFDIMHQVLNLPLSLDCNVALIVVAFRDVRITSRIAQASARNDEVCRTARGARIEFMGHLIGIGEEVARMLELLGAALEPLIAPFVDADEWLDYVVRALQEARERDQHPLGGGRPGAPAGMGAGPGADVDMVEADSSSQVFVSRMGLVDPSMHDAYDDEDLDDDDEDLDDDEDPDEGGARRRQSESPARGGGSGMLYPNEEDDAVDYISSHSNLYFGRRASSGSNGGNGGLHPLVADDEDQFIVRDDDDGDDDFDAIECDDDIGPADTIGRFHSYQNEHVPATSSSDEDADDSPKHAEEDPAAADDDSDDASESGRMSDFLRSRAADAADATRESSDSDPANSYRVTPPEVVEDAAARRRALLVPSNEDEDAADMPPPMPPRPSDADCGSFQSGVIPGQGSLALMPGADGEPDLDSAPRPKGRVHDLLFRESKQRSLSSSELDNIVPADIGSWGPLPPPPQPAENRPLDAAAVADGTVSSPDPSSLGAGLTGAGEGRERSDSFAGRRRRSRSQSAGVGISRAMVIQAAVKGQFPYLDAKTCQFVGQLKSDTVTLGGAAAGGSRQRVAPAVPPLPAGGSPSMKPVARDDDQMPALPAPQRPSARPPSGLRVRSSAVSSDSDDEAPAPAVAASGASSSSSSSAFPAISLLPPIATTHDANG